MTKVGSLQPPRPVEQDASSTLADLQRGLDRLDAATRAGAEPASVGRVRASKGAPVWALPSAAGLAAAATAAGYAAAGPHWVLWVPAALAGGLVTALVVRMGRRGRAASAALNPPKIGFGASVKAGAVIEPGAVVEMGADIGEGATIRRGARVKSGASVHARAIIEEGAVVSWGADVRAGARVCERAIVGAGSTVREDAEVPAGMRLLPGSDWAMTRSTSGRPLPEPPPPDPREARLGAICGRIADELRQAAPEVRAFLGASEATVPALRAACARLLERERVLREEGAARTLATLEQERTSLAARAAAAADEDVRRSLASAVEAIDEQLRHRLALATAAERIAADLTRLEWSLDGLAAQLVRLRTARDTLGGAPQEDLLQSVRQLNQQIDALATAVEEVSSPPEGAP